MKLLFITMIDPSGRSGRNIATASVIDALAHHPGVDLTLICPEPASDDTLPGLAKVLETALFLPARPTHGSLFSKIVRGAVYHLTTFVQMTRYLQQMKEEMKGGAIVARLDLWMIAAPLFARRWGVPYLLLVRGKLRPRSRFNPIVRVNLKLATRVYAAYEEVVALVETVSGRGDQTEIVHNAVDPDRFRPLPMKEARERVADWTGRKVSGSDFWVGFVGSLKERHGLQPLFDGFAQFKNHGHDHAKLLIVGAGPLRGHLEDVVRKQGLEDSVIFAGSISPVDVPWYMAACNVLYGVVHPEIPSNPIKCYEYLACERPIVTTQNDAFGFVEEHELGAVISQLAGREVAGALTQLNRAGDTQLAVMGKRGRDYVQRHHTWAIVAEAIVKGAGQRG